jgi:hypothetical protein
VSVVSGVARLSFLEMVRDEIGAASFPRSAVTLHIKDLAELRDVISQVLEDHAAASSDG